jgi:gamma-glutamylcyclotransferase
MNNMVDATLYFGYGSNLWQHQMTLRCPHSRYLGLARLKHWHWIINARGYANVVQNRSAPVSSENKQVEADSAADEHDEEDEVWGLVYSLTADDEARLDVNEGVPEAYTKEFHPCDFWPAKSGQKIDPGALPVKKDLLVYVDRKRTQSIPTPKEEYVHRMNMGIRDALNEGVPAGYVEKVLRRWIPAEETGGERESWKLAQKQARGFVEEDDREGGVG